MTVKTVSLWMIVSSSSKLAERNCKNAVEHTPSR